MKTRPNDRMALLCLFLSILLALTAGGMSAAIAEKKTETAKNAQVAQAETEEEIISTGKAKEITESSATVTVIINETKKKTDQFGLEYGYSRKKVKILPYATDGSGTAKKGKYQLTLSGLKAGEKVYYRAYLKKGKKTVYGSWKSFTTKEKTELAKETLTVFRLSHVDHDRKANQQIRSQKEGAVELDRAITLPGNAPGTKFTYRVEADAAWKLTGKGDWFTIGENDGEGAAGKSYIDLIFTKKVGNKAKSGQLTFSFADGQKISIKVKKPEYTAFDRAFTEPSSGISNLLANQSIAGAIAAYGSEKKAKDFLSKLGFTEISGFSFASGTHTAGHEIGRKVLVDSAGNIVNLYAIVIRGTNSSNVEWRSNFSVGSGSRHYGFDQAALQVKNHLDSYISDHNDGIGGDRYIVWICGHSRGAAVGNLLAGYYLASRPQSTVYAYLFATPNVSTRASGSGNNIKNFVIAGDLVPRLPLRSWGYKKYGAVYTLSDEGAASYGLNVLSSQKTDELVEKIGKLVREPADAEKLKELIDEKGTFSGANLINSAESILKMPLEKLLEIYLGMKMEELKTKVYNGHVPQSYQRWIANAYPVK